MLSKWFCQILYITIYWKKEEKEEKERGQGREKREEREADKKRVMHKYI